MSPKPRKRPVPKLPPVAYSHLGELPVTAEDDLMQDEEAMGITRFRPRNIGIDSGSGKEAQLQTFCHELIEVALWDGGVHNLLPADQKETVCDAIGSYLAAAAINGYVKFTVPRKKA